MLQRFSSCKKGKQILTMHYILLNIQRYYQLRNSLCKNGLEILAQFLDNLPEISGKMPGKY